MKNKSIYLLKALNDIDDRFLIQEYQPIRRENSKNFFKEGVISMKNIKLKYILSPVFILAIVIISIITFRNFNHTTDDMLLAKENDITENVEKENYVDEININEIIINDFMGTEGDVTDIDARCVDTDITEQFSFLNNIYIPIPLEEKNLRQGEIYVREDLNDDDYSELYQYFIVYFDNSQPQTKSIEINFSKNELLPDCIPSAIETAKESLINNTKVKLFATEKKDAPSKIRGEAYFEYNGYKFDIEVTMITEEEFIEVVKSVITQVKYDNVIS